MMNFFARLNKFVSGPDKNPYQERKKMLEGKLDSLKSIGGYQASAITDYTGDLLTADFGQIREALEKTTAGVAKLYTTAEKTGKDLKIGNVRSVVITTAERVILIASTGEDARARIYAVVILDRNGNRALARPAIEKLLEDSLKALSA